MAVIVARHLRAPLEFVRADPMGEDRDVLRPDQPEHPGAGTGGPRAHAVGDRCHRAPSRCDWPACGTRRSGRRASARRGCSGSAAARTTSPAPATSFYAGNIIAPRYFGRGPDPRALAQAADFHGFAAVLDGILADRTWLVGDRVTYADFRVASVLPFAAGAWLPLEPHRRIVAWHARLMELDAWRDPFDGLD